MLKVTIHNSKEFRARDGAVITFSDSFIPTKGDVWAKLYEFAKFLKELAGDNDIAVVIQAAEESTEAIKTIPIALMEAADEVTRVDEYGNVFPVKYRALPPETTPPKARWGI